MLSHLPDPVALAAMAIEPRPPTFAVVGIGRDGVMDLAAVGATMPSRQFLPWR